MDTMGKVAGGRRSRRHHEPERPRGTRQDALVIVNPAAAAGRVGRSWPRVAATLREAGLKFAEALTTGPGEATTIAREAVKQSQPLVVALGGDGTLNEVLNGFFEGGEPIPTESVLGLVPFGTGGDTRRTLGIPADIAGAARILVEGRPRRLDAGRVRVDGKTLHFIDVAEAGLGAVVSDQVNRAPKYLGGKASFYIGTLRGLLAWRHQLMHVVVDGSAPRELLAQGVAIANCQYYGGGMRIAPDALPDDGLFDVVIRGGIGTVEGLLNFGKLYDGSYAKNAKLMEKIEIIRGKRIEITSPESVLVQVEGEVVGKLPAVFEMMPAAISFMVPR
ncbi:MAG: diacylglycerol kinase family lipid kinase [Chloroflexi bacterium]|nr:MAG: diacylglycerol kinase family lipid kinase [Chloroflexota bacterium]